MFNEVWQYGSDERPGGDKKYNQDGVAPQCAVYGLERGGRDKGIGGRVPFQGPKENKNFLDAHYARSYDWILKSIVDPKSDGYVKKR